jgi:hypothetical protein
MKKKLLALGTIGVSVILLAVYLCGCTSNETENNKFNEEQILQKFDGYQWSWRCFTSMNNYTLWREHIYSVEKNGNYWIIQGNSSERNDETKSISPDEAGTILIVYDEVNDIVTDWLHGKEIPDLPEINENGKVTNPTGIIYC